MKNTVRRLRAQKAYSTDPAYLERLAREEEARGGADEDARHREQPKGRTQDHDGN